MLKCILKRTIKHAVIGVRSLYVKQKLYRASLI